MNNKKRRNSIDQTKTKLKASSVNSSGNKGNRSLISEDKEISVSSLVLDQNSISANASRVEDFP